MGQRTFELSRRLMACVDRIDRGLSISRAWIATEFGIGGHAAGEYIKFVREQRPLASRRNGAGKEWFLAVDRVVPTEAELDRAAALAFAVEALADLQGARYHLALEEAAEQARNALGAEPGRHDRVVRGFLALRPERSSNKDYGAFLEVLLDAVRDRRPVRFAYTRLDAQRKTYEVEPWTLAFHRGRAFLLGGKRTGDRWPPRRCFAVDRMRELQTLQKERIEAPARRHEPHRLFEDSFGLYSFSGQDAEDIVLRVRGSAAAMLRDRRIHRSQQLRDLSDEWTELRLHVCVCPELTSWVMGLLPDVRIVAPAPLSAAVRAACMSYLASPSGTASIAE